jgi:hypothetical protein
MAKKWKLLKVQTGLEISAGHRSLSGKLFHFDRQILYLTGHAWPASFSNVKMRSRANFCFAQFRVYWEKWKSNHTCTSSLKIGANKKIKRWPAKHPSWPANLIMHRSRWPVYLPDLFRGLGIEIAPERYMLMSEKRSWCRVPGAWH